MSLSNSINADNRGKWTALIAALLGWLFDGFEIGMFPLVGTHALRELLSDEIASNPNVVDQWFGAILSVFLIGAATGGVFFGWLGDRLGRVRAMSLSILTYALFTGFCGFASEAWQIAILRFIASLGMGGEWALGVSLVTELWSDKSRALIAGLIGAAANVGFLLVGLLSLTLVRILPHVTQALRWSGLLSESAIDALVRNEGWRLLMIAGAAPAAIVFFIRLFVPESKKWEAAQREGATSYWATKDLLGVLVGSCAAIVMVGLWSPLGEQWLRGYDGATAGATSVILRWALTLAGVLIALLGFMHPVSRYMKRATESKMMTIADSRLYRRRLLLGALLAAIPLLGTWGSLQWAPKWAIALSSMLPAGKGPYYAKEFTQISSATGAIVGSILAALAGGLFGRRVTYAVLCVGSFASLAFMYSWNDAFGAALLASVFVAGSFTAAFYGWFPLYFPELFPTSIRATSQGFAYNFGRVLSAVGASQTAVLTVYFSQGITAERIAIDAFPRAGATLAGIYLLGLLVIWFGPETKGLPLPD